MQPSTTIAFLILLLAALLAGASAVSEHKALFPMNDADVYAMVLAGAGLALAACGGIGGGGILVPVSSVCLVTLMCGVSRECSPCRKRAMACTAIHGLGWTWGGMSDLYLCKQTKWNRCTRI
jgi:membrane protease YdiL (CAAX protease family)